MRQTLSAAIALTLASSAFAQAPDGLTDTTIDSRTRTQVIDGVLRHLHDGYILPDKATEIARAIRTS